MKLFFDKHEKLWIGTERDLTSVGDTRKEAFRLLLLILRVERQQYNPFFKTGE